MACQAAAGSVSAAAAGSASAVAAAAAGAVVGHLAVLGLQASGSQVSCSASLAVPSLWQSHWL